ncbi:MAG: isochorismatase family protein [Alphaproteobacteria bacterium]|nr:isochorismatase family protein [Alphaproteobacteria bacterium]
MALEQFKTALIVIDVQKDYQAGGALEIAGFDKAAVNIAKLLAWARAGRADVFHVRHVCGAEEECFRANSPGVEFAAGFEPCEGEGAFTKSLPSAFSAPKFKAALERGRYDRLAICGYSSFMCCDSTSREAYHRGWKVLFVEDAIGEFALDGFSEEELHKYACAVQGCEFARVVKTAELVSA